MRVLVACEESQEVCKAFRARGHEAYSCDIQPCSGGHPEWHIQGDVLKILNPNQISSKFYGIVFRTMNGDAHAIEGEWDLIIAHPPCTYLTLAGNKWFKPKYKDRFPEREREREDAIAFFMQFANAECDRIAIENPVCIMSSRWRKPDQYIEPYFFGEPEKKKTGLWLKGLPLLKPTNIVEPIIIHCASGANEPRWHMETMTMPKEERSKARSKTFPGIAHAMAEQWGAEEALNGGLTMAEYIEREAVMQAFSDYVWNSNQSDLVPAPQWNHAVDIVRDYPAADVVPVVRCGECENWQSDWKPRAAKAGTHFCATVGLCTSADWFCADGARMDGDRE